MSKKKYSTDQKDVILHEIFVKISNGSSARQAIIESEINNSTFFEWLQKDTSKQYAESYTRACEIRAEKLTDEILQIADEANADIVGVDEKTGKPIVNGEAINRSRLKVDARKWLAGKLAPKKYGDKIDVTSKGESIQAPSVVNVKIVEPED
jgi:hypothetical protein